MGATPTLGTNIMLTRKNRVYDSIEMPELPVKSFFAGAAAIMVFVVILNLAALGAAVWIVIWLLQYMGVI